MQMQRCPHLISPGGVDQADNIAQKQFLSFQIDF